MFLLIYSLNADVTLQPLVHVLSRGYIWNEKSFASFLLFYFTRNHVWNREKKQKVLVAKYFYNSCKTF